MVLCAGLGTRLRPLTDELPKPLVPLGDRPLLAHIWARLQAAGTRRLVINTHHLANRFVNVHELLHTEVQQVHEEEIRGTAGGIAGARALLGPGSVVVWNGDILASPPLGSLLSAAGETGLAFAVCPRPKGEGTLGVDAAGSIVRLRGHQFGVEVRGGDYLGVAALDEATRAALPERGCLVGDVALPALAAGRRVRAVDAPGPWTDLGDPESYHAANLRWLEQEALDTFRAADARVAPGVELEQCVLGGGVEVRGSGRLTRVVAWPGAIVEAPLSDAIVLGSGRVVSISR